MDLMHLADEELPVAKAMVEQSKAAAVTARRELDKHRRWLGQHRELYAQAVKKCERRLKRKAFTGACKQKAWVPIQLLTTWTDLFYAGLAYPQHRGLKAKLKNRIEEAGYPSEHDFRRLQERIHAMDPRGPSTVGSGARPNSSTPDPSLPVIGPWLKQKREEEQRNADVGDQRPRLGRDLSIRRDQGKLAVRRLLHREEPQDKTRRLCRRSGRSGA
jgi:hypothetical protein